LLSPASRPGPARSGLGGIDARRQLERDLHDGGQNEIVALIIKLTVAEQDPGTPPALAAHARSILDSVRQVACGIYPPMFADSGVLEALRAQAVRASVHMSLAGTPLRSIQAAETALYFSCLEAIQNVANHAGRTAHASLGLHHQHGVLAVRVEDDGRGFDSEDTPRRCGLRNIHERIQALGDTVTLTFAPGLGTVLMISLPWPLRTAEDLRQPQSPSGIPTQTMGT
jgi:signal transduction histidine kinase